MAKVALRATSPVIFSKGISNNDVGYTVESNICDDSSSDIDSDSESSSISKVIRNYVCSSSDDSEDESESDFIIVPPIEQSKAKVDTNDWPKVVHEAVSDEEYTKQFDQLMAQGLMLKPAIADAVLNVNGVESAGIGRSSTGPRPCIRIVVDSTSKDEIRVKVASSVHEALQEEWKVDTNSIQQMIEVNEDASEMIFELQNHITPGGMIEQTSGDTVKCEANITCFIRGDLFIEAATVKRLYTVHFPLTCHHCLMPTQDETFKRIASEYDQPVASYLRLSEWPKGIPLVKGRPSDPDQVATLLHTMRSPQQLQQALEKSETYCRFQQKPSKKLKYLAGKFGLFGVKDYRSNPSIHMVIVNETAREEYAQLKGFKFGPHNFHPCNLDVGAGQLIHDAIIQCSFEEAFCPPLVPTWHPPLTLPTWHPTPDSVSSESLWKDEVIVLSNVDGEIKQIQLAPYLSDIHMGKKMEIQGNSYQFPFFSWKLSKKIDGYAFSGLPSFLYNKQTNSYKFLGGLYTDSSASKISFAIDSIRPAFCVAISQNAIEQLKYEKKELKDRIDRARRQREHTRLEKIYNELKVMMKTLKQYCRIVEKHEAANKQFPPSHEMFTDLDVVQQGGHDNCKLKFTLEPCITSHD